MRRRMAGLARHRQIDGNWRARGRGGPLPLQIPYPPMHGYQPPIRVRGAAAPVGAGAAAGARAHPMYPRPLLQGAAPGDWQPLVGMGMDWGKPPYAMPPPPYALNHIAAAAGAAARAAAGRGAAVGGAPAAPGAAAVGQGDPGGAQQQQPVSQEEYLDRKRKMLIAQADTAMKRASVVGARIPGAGRVRGLGGDPPVAGEGSHLVRERLEQQFENQLEKGKAVLEERRRALRDARKELEEFPLPDGFPYRSRLSQLAAGARASGVAVSASMEENVPDAAMQPHRRLPVRESADGAPARKPDSGVFAVLAPPAGGPNHHPRMRRFPPDDPKIPPEMLDTGIGDGANGKKAMGVWGWGRVENRFAGGEAGGAARGAAAAGQPSEDPKMSRRARNEACFSNMMAKSAAKSDSDAHEKSDSDGRGAGHPRIERIDLDPAASGPGAHADYDRGHPGDMDGDNGLADDWLGVLPWPLRSVSAKPRRKPREEGEGVEGKGLLPRPAAAVAGAARRNKNDDEDEVVCWGEEEGDFAFPPPGMKRRKKGRLGVGVSFAGIEEKRQGDDDADTPPAAVVDGGMDRAERSYAVERRRVAGSDANPVDTPEQSPKRVHFGSGRFGMRRWKRELEDGWLALDRASARSGAGAGVVAGFPGRNEQEEKEAAGGAADVVIADVGAGGAAGAGVDRVAGNYQPGRVGWSRNARVAAATTAAAAGAAASQGAVPRGASGAGIDIVSHSSNPSAAAAGAAAGVAAAAPKADHAKLVKGAEAGSVAGYAASPATEQTKEERAEMVARALKKYSYYQVGVIKLGCFM